MNIINEEELKEMVNKRVDEEISNLTDEIIKTKIQELLFDRVNGIFSEWKSMDYLVEKIVEDTIKKQIPKISEKDLDKACLSISDNLSYTLGKSIKESIASQWMPTKDEDDELLV